MVAAHHQCLAEKVRVHILGTIPPTERGNPPRMIVLKKNWIERYFQLQGFDLSFSASFSI